MKTRYVVAYVENTLLIKVPNVVDVSNTPLKRIGIFEEALSGTVSVESNIAFAIIIEMPGPKRFIAVPEIVWSAPSLTVATAYAGPKSIVKGQILDSNGNPVPNATVTFTTET